MQIDINGKRNITLDFNAPKKFRLVKDGAEIPYIRTGKNSFRLSKPVEGFVELEEIVEQPRYMQPVQLQPQQMTVINPQDVDRLNEAVRQMSLVNPQDVIIINQTAEQLEKNQNFIAQTQKEITDNQVYIDQQQQRLNETALGIQALETDNSQRLDGAENAILNLAGEISNAQDMAIDGMNTALNKIEEQGILLQAEIDKKADKDELETLRKDFEEKSDQFSNAMSNYSGGYAYDTLPRDGETGQILAKRTDRQGDYIWIDQTPVIVKSKTIPTASEKYKGEVYQYVGETGDYTHGYIYECQEIENNFVWVRLDVQPNTAVWGQITGTLSDQTDLQEAFDDKQDKLTQTQMDAVNSGANQSNIAQISVNTGNITTLSQTKQDTLVSGTNIKTVNNTSLLGAGNIAVQPTLVSGTNIKTINNNSILGSGNLDINGLPTQTGQSGKFLTTDGTDASWADVDALPSQTGQSGKYLTTDGSSASWATLSVNPDNKSITTNSSDELQTVGVINSRDSSTAIKTWTGTKAQYDAIVTKDPNTLYNITDDSQSGTDIYSKTEVDTLLNGKADIDLSNMNPTQTVKNTIVGWGMPDYANAIEMSLATSELLYACPKNGIIAIDTAGFNGNYCYLKINDVTMFNKTSNGNSYMVGAVGSYLVSTGDVIKAKSGYGSGFAATDKLIFIPLKGAN
jgi:hypothetical protein